MIGRSLLVVALLSTVALGCSGGRGRARLDSTIRRQATAGAEAFAEGEVDEADQRYASALRRAWQLDDAEEIAHAAYNLAAVRASQRRYREAEDLLAEAEAELLRANESPRDVYLLEAKIARAVGDLGTAAQFTARAEASFCSEKGTKPGRYAREMESRARERRRSGADDRGARTRRENAAFEAQSHLLRAQLALDEGRSAAAEQRIADAEPWVRQADDDSVSAEYEHVRGALAVVQGRYSDAAARFDAEADLLRSADNYRELSTAYEAAAVSYESVGRFAAASERFFRSARLWYGRGYSQQAVRPLSEAARLADAAGRGDLDARIAILFSFVSAELAAEGGERAPAPEEIPPAEPAIEFESDAAPEPPRWLDEESVPVLVLP